MVSVAGSGHVEISKTREEWRRLHMATIGGSSAAAVVGKARFKRPMDLWKRMAMVLEGKLPADTPPSGDMRRGLLHEPIAMEQLAKEVGASVTPHVQNLFLYRDDSPWAHALPDAWVGEDMVELKCPRPGTVARVNIRGLFDEWTMQAQHNMHVARALRPRCRRCLVTMYDSIEATTFIHPVDYDPAYAAELMEHEREFYESIKAGTPPPLDPEATAADEIDPDTIALDDEESIQLAETWLRLKALDDDLADAFGATKEKLVAKIGNHNMATVGNVAKIRFKFSKPATTLKKDIVLAKYPAIRDDTECWKPHKPARPFVVTPMRKDGI
jgi:predicted phage-related endonuclease